MKISLPYYVVGLFATFVYGVLLFYFPQFPFTEAQILLVIVGILAVLGVDVANTVLKVANELRSLLANLRGQKII